MLPGDLHGFVAVAGAQGRHQASGSLICAREFFNDTSSVATSSAGAAIAAYSFLGFDAVTTLTEETINPRKNMPRAIMLIALIGGGIFVTVSYVTQLVHPGGVFEDSASAASSIALEIGGQLFGAVFLAGLVVEKYASGLAARPASPACCMRWAATRSCPRRSSAGSRQVPHARW